MWSRWSIFDAHVAWKRINIGKSKAACLSIGLKALTFEKENGSISKSRFPIQFFYFMSMHEKVKVEVQHLDDRSVRRVVLNF